MGCLRRWRAWGRVVGRHRPQPLRSRLGGPFGGAKASGLGRELGPGGLGDTASRPRGPALVSLDAQVFTFNQSVTREGDGYAVDQPALSRCPASAGTDQVCFDVRPEL